MRPLSRLLTIAPLLCVAACASVQPVALDSQNTQRLGSGGKLAVTRYATPDFVAATPGKGAFAMLGALAMISEGNQFVKDKGIEDPATAVAAALGTSLRSAYPVTLADAPALTGSDTIDAIVAANPGRDFVLDIKTTGWGYTYLPTQWSTYQINYRARARLIDVQRKAVIAESGCVRDPKTTGDAYSFEQLTGDQGRAVKQALAAYASVCAAELAANMFGIKSEIPAQAPVAAAAEPAAKTIPFINQNGQNAYREFLGKPMPRAFAISSDGHYAYAWGARPADPAAPVDVKERALFNCKKAGGAHCTAYMVNDTVVYAP